LSHLFITILNISQITEALDDLVTHTAALLSLIYALMSCEIWYDEKHVPCITMGRGEYLLVGNIFSSSSSSRGAKNENLERLGIFGDACRMDVPKLEKGFHALNSLQDDDTIFIRYSFFCVADYGYDHYDIEEVWISDRFRGNVANFRYGE
jgi:hypothetical protein